MRSEKFKAIVKELFIRCRKLNISRWGVVDLYWGVGGGTGGGCHLIGFFIVLLYLFPHVLSPFI